MFIFFLSGFSYFLFASGFFLSSRYSFLIFSFIYSGFTESYLYYNLFISHEKLMPLLFCYPGCQFYLSLHVFLCSLLILCISQSKIPFQFCCWNQLCFFSLQIILWHPHTPFVFWQKVWSKCIEYQALYKVKHFLITCGDLTFTKCWFYSTNSVRDLFENVDGDDLQSFIKEVALYSTSKIRWLN